ncbi:MAG: hypothetical protein K0Q87_4225 [Neobacillus sp.]|nr:hypothetical protein [Neobacillus sp.]
MVNQLSQTHYITIPMSQKDCMIEIKKHFSAFSVDLCALCKDAVLMIHRIKRNNKGTASTRFF